MEAGDLVTLDLFVNGQVAARLASISLDNLTILSGPAEPPAGAEGQLPGFWSAQDWQWPVAAAGQHAR